MKDKLLIGIAFGVLAHYGYSHMPAAQAAYYGLAIVGVQYIVADVHALIVAWGKATK